MNLTNRFCLSWRWSLLTAVLLSFLLPTPATLLADETDEGESRTALIYVTTGQKPNDVGSDTLDKLSIVASKELGDKTLKVSGLAGDSFGLSRSKLTDWSGFHEFRVMGFNPTKKPCDMMLTIVHGQTKNFDTRMDLHVRLTAGKSQISVALDKQTNNDGSAPDWQHIKRWYIVLPKDAPQELFFGDFWLVGSTSKAAGKAPGKTHSDPARLARIRKTKKPAFKAPVMFDTPEADAIVSALEIFPPDHALNQLVTDWPLHSNSAAIVAAVGADKPLRYNPDMSYILVPPNQPKVEVKIVGYPGESDRGPYPVPANAPIEGWPVHYTRNVAEKLTLDQVQRNTKDEQGDRHMILVDPVQQKLYEFFVTKKTDLGWQAAQASIFDLKTGKSRPDGWTSADAAGLPIFPLTVRYDELKRGVIDHPLRMTVRKSRRAYVSPATHFASRHENEEYPRMGERFRLRADFDLSGFSPEIQTILTALKRYGMIVADNGIEWAVSVTPDPRIPVLHEELRKVKGSDFEVIVAP